MLCVVELDRFNSSMYISSKLNMNLLATKNYNPDITVWLLPNSPEIFKVKKKVLLTSTPFSSHMRLKCRSKILKNS